MSPFVGLSVDGISAGTPLTLSPFPPADEP